MSEQERYRAWNTRPDVERTSALSLAVAAGCAAAAGAAGVILGILAFTCAYPLSLTAAGALVVGAGLMLYSAGAITRVKRRYREAGDQLQSIALIGGVGAAVIGGAGACVLAICALAGAVPSAVLPATVIVIGSALVLLAPAHQTFAWLAPVPERPIHRAAYRATAATVWALVLAGSASIIIGALTLMIGEPLVALCAAAVISLGAALLLAAGATALRYAGQLPAREDRELIAARLVELLHARLGASTTGFKLYETVLGKLRRMAEPGLEPLIEMLETFADKELENTKYLAAQIDGLGGDVEEPSALAEIEHRVTSGIEAVITSEAVVEPMHLLYALHAADMSDAAGWELLMQAVEQVGHHELKKEIADRHGDKSEQVRSLGLVIERMTRRRFVGEPIAIPLSAYN